MSSTAGLQVRFSLESRQVGGKWVNVEYIRVISMTDKFNSPHRPVEPADKVRFEAQYEAWKRGLESLPADGQPLKTWPGIQPAEVSMLAQAGVYTVEALAGAPDKIVGTDGPYAALRESARRYLELSASAGALTRLEAEVARERAEKEHLFERLAAVEKRLQEPEPAGEEQPRRGPGRPRKSESATE